SRRQCWARRGGSGSQASAGDPGQCGSAVYLQPLDGTVGITYGRDESAVAGLLTCLLAVCGVAFTPAFGGWEEQAASGLVCCLVFGVLLFLELAAFDVA